MKRIGIDVGGTNTDAVLLDDSTILRSIKTPTTADVTAGVKNALAHVLGGADGAVRDVRAVMIGTTHFTNAVIERRGLSRVAVIRIGLPAASSIPPLADWPDDLRRAVEGPVFLLEGGHEFDGRPIVAFDRAGMRRAAQAIRDSGVTAAAITAVFSPLIADCEAEAAAILAEVAPEVTVTLSSHLGRIGLIERENATILNSALHGLAGRTVAAFRQAIAETGLEGPLYLTQNDGTVLRAEEAERVPVLCFASGPTNSMRGAHLLSGLADAVVLDVGGTTTDAGMLRAGFPRQANTQVDIGGVRTFFRMPDVVAVALGGGTVVRDEPFAVGPDSVGFRLLEKARVAGGDTLTLTDIGVRLGLIELGDAGRLADLPAALTDMAQRWITGRLADLVDRMKTSAGDLPVIAVGGGAFLVPDSLPGVSTVLKVEHAGVANAVGAAMAQVSGESERIFYGVPRERAISETLAAARAQAVAAGADEATLDVLDIEDTPMSYIPGDPLRVRVRVVGDLAG
ncbi:N-methylhydantoinase A/oxoprolinase/acetone carboxylase beta subunit [Ancylobacter sp. 3268]|uniref:hydantoinase/oxoprolinase family protein n=1 Tax=Ancylobacter sp. 3268 TaxID=2817752 RepID=UPI00285FD222|nr:hydantoinase/oxoprolinase family protein [Ancylobacter sp. 3268]MDR6954802.1 N-methylhydantoinase A/oxoprolinase/acetone carboxylase beta subunit [Ancylobacter sp. 3268]